MFAHCSGAIAHCFGAIARGFATRVRARRLLLLPPTYPPLTHRCGVWRRRLGPLRLERPDRCGPATHLHDDVGAIPNGIHADHQRLVRCVRVRASVCVCVFVLQSNGANGAWVLEPLDLGGEARGPSGIV